MRIRPLTLNQANELVARWHRHHKPARGHRFSIGIEIAGQLHGAAIVGRPVARRTDASTTAEVTRVVTDGTPNACSKLYAAAARIAREMGFDTIQTFTLTTEPGTSLRAAGWEQDTTRRERRADWDCPSRRRQDPSTDPMVRTRRWFKRLA